MTVRHWSLNELELPADTRSPVVLLSEDEARAVVIGVGPGQALGNHQVKEHAWLIVLEGRVVVRSNGEAVEAGTGTLLRFEPDERHSVASAEGARILLLLAPWPGPGHYRGEERTVASVS